MAPHGFKKSGNNFAIFEVLGEDLEYFEQISMEFWGCFLLFHISLSILQYFTLYYIISNYSTLIVDSMVGYLTTGREEKSDPSLR